MDPKARFALNPGAKEHRLQKLRKRLEAATPKRPTTKRRTAKPEPTANLWPWLVLLAVLVWIIKRLA